MLDSTAQGRIIQHVDYRAMNVRDQDLAVTAPDGPGAEDSVFPDMLETETHAVVPRELSTYRPTRQDNDIVENLLCEIPVLRGAAFAWMLMDP